MTEYQTLKLTRPMMHGSAVVRLQEILSVLTPYFEECDGIFGVKTQNAVHFFQGVHGLVRDGICGPETWKALLFAVENKEYCDTKDNVIVDRIGLHSNPRLYKCKRPWSTITGVTLHQTGCEMPSNPSGWDRLNAHIGITQEGLVILVNDPTYFIWHAQGLSASTIGIEIEGNYCGIDGDMSTLWKGGGGPHHITNPMLYALDCVLEWLKDEFSKHGQKWQHIHAHRQSAKSRIGDPGEEIWKKVAIPWAEDVIPEFINEPNQGYWDGGFEFRIGTGRPIPKQWDDTCDMTEYNCKPGGEK